MEEQEGPSLEMVCSLCKYLTPDEDGEVDCIHPRYQDSVHWYRGWSLPQTLLTPDWCPVRPQPRVTPVASGEHKYVCPKCKSEFSTLHYSSFDSYEKRKKYCICGAWFDWDGVA